MYDAVIVGGGPAGLTAALYLARARYRVVVVEKEHFGGQITITAEVVNYPGVARTSGTALTEAMRQQAQSFGAEFLLAEVQSLRMDGDIKTVHTSRGVLKCFGVLLATGAHPRTVGFAGEEEFRGRGVAYCATCDGGFFRGRTAAVVGGGNSALEDALYLANLCKKVYIIYRRSSFRGFKSIADQVAARENIKVLYSSELTAVDGDFQDEQITDVNTQDGSQRQLAVDGLFIAIGMEPANEIFGDDLKLDERGFICAGEDCRTNLPGVFAAGDIRTKPLRQVITAAADGAVAAMSAFE